MSLALSTTKSSHGRMSITRTKTKTDSNSRTTANIIIITSGALITMAITTRITIITPATAADSTVTNPTITLKSEIGTTTNSGQTTTTRKIRIRTYATVGRAVIVAGTKSREIRAALVLGVGVGVKVLAIHIKVVILGDRGEARGRIALNHDPSRGHVPQSR